MSKTLGYESSAPKLETLLGDVFKERERMERGKIGFHRQSHDEYENQAPTSVSSNADYFWLEESRKDTQQITEHAY